jgi:hypothetical protein
VRESVPFLVDGFLPARDYRAVPRREAKLVASASAPVLFVFHSGFCCSTLFARCFDQPSLATTFSEPMLLNDIHGWRMRGASPADAGRLLDDSLDLLARPFEGDQASVLKPSTVVNGLAQAMLKLRPAATAVIMYAPLADFLVSIAKKSLDGRLWARELFIAMRRERLVEGMGFTDEQFVGQTDLQIAAITWLGQQRIFHALIEQFPGRVRSLDSASFLKSPDRALASAADFFPLELSKDQLAEAERRELRRNSKDGTPYSRGAREADYRSARAAYGDEIDKVGSWAEAVAKSCGIALPLGQPLI